jgi:hypothetical protein
VAGERTLKTNNMIMTIGTKVKAKHSPFGTAPLYIKGTAKKIPGNQPDYICGQTNDLKPPHATFPANMVEPVKIKA